MKKNKSVHILMFLVVVFISLTQQSWSQRLPPPSGNFSIGYHRFEWTDTSRTEKLATDNTMRRIVAELWYPAKRAAGATVPYIDTLAFKHAFGNKGLQSFIGAQGAALVSSNAVHTHAHEDAAFDRRLASAPVIFFSHGMGMIPNCILRR